MTERNISRLISLALFSGTGLFLEIALTRLISSLYYPPYVFVVLTLAILGIGLGAATATWHIGLRQEKHLPLYMALTGFSTLILVGFAVLAAPLDLQPVLVVLVALPYFFSGLTVAALFSLTPGGSYGLYMADLVGAGLGTLLAVPILDGLGAINSVVCAAAVFGAAGMLIHWRTVSRLTLTVIALAIVTLVTNLGADWLSVDDAALSLDKPIVDDLRSGGQIIETSWDSFARTDLVQPGDGGPYRIYVDGAAGSVMPPAEDNAFLLNNIGYFPFSMAHPQSVFIVGPGGGLDVWFALQSAAEQIVAVEVNPASVALVRRYAKYNGDLYDHPQVDIRVDEGRSVLRREDVRYDLIYLSQVITLSAELSSYTLTENTIYTVEAFRDYLDYLRPGGQIALILYDEATMTRALSVAMEVFRQQGQSDPEALSRVAAFLDPGTTPPTPLLIIRNAPFTREEALASGRLAQDSGFVPLFLPPVLAQQPLDAVVSGRTSFPEIISQSDFDLSPTTDDRPFFFQFERGIPESLLPLLALVGIVVVTGSGMLVYTQRRIKNRLLRWSPLYFAGLGVGFIGIEMAVIQQTRLFLGHPTLAVAVTLAVLLIGGGIGSGLAGRRLSENSSVLGWPAAGAAIIVLIWTLIWPLLSQALFAAGLPVRIVIVVVSLLPLALIMGVPFPMGLRALGHSDEQHVALAWTVNGITTVAGSVGAVSLAVTNGFTSVLVASAVIYALTAILAHYSLTKRH